MLSGSSRGPEGGAMTERGLLAHALELLEANRYLTLGTVDAQGRPWTTPVYFAADGTTHFYWSSSGDSAHSLHIAARPDVSLVVFDSTVPPYHGRAVYGVGTASELAGADLEVGLAVYPGSAARGGTVLV